MKLILLTLLAAFSLSSCNIIKGLEQTAPHRAMTQAELDAYMKGLPPPKK